MRNGGLTMWRVICPFHRRRCSRASPASNAWSATRYAWWSKTLFRMFKSLSSPISEASGSDGFKKSPAPPDRLKNSR